jgi:crossover junction endodeoxyribonuclease RusA
MELPYPPTVNKYWTYSKIGRRVLTAEARKYKNLVAWDFRLNTAFNQPIDTPVVAWIELYPPDNRVRDTDNTQKAIFDALQHAGVITNDKLIVEHHVKMFHKSPPHGFVRVIILDAKESEWINK